MENERFCWNQTTIRLTNKNFCHNSSCSRCKKNPLMTSAEVRTLWKWCGWFKMLNKEALEGKWAAWSLQKKVVTKKSDRRASQWCEPGAEEIPTTCQLQQLVCRWFTCGSGGFGLLTPALKVTFIKYKITERVSGLKHSAFRFCVGCFMQIWRNQRRMKPNSDDSV